MPVRRVLAAATRLPVHVDGHARALALAELMFGAGWARGAGAAPRRQRGGRGHRDGRRRPARPPVGRGRCRASAARRSRAAALLLDLINPEVLVVAEAAAVHFPELLPDLHEEVAAHSHLCADPERAVVPASFGQQVLAVAAGAVVLDAVYRRPMELRTARSA
ncbi:hypothetical protein QMK19_17165 [Streptomyces sp. H10-C2]|uniref:hypothetical protein n=1 Tax=unclassified Streptomyces TaxID=2593676 RepID=UPI0024B98181|nr:MULTISPECIES: hypothetical protein [unclassified Streptomyces]MDJ0341532.1 hypothetical protein [Streptomyces sp. PH10-H1]MDJ0371366.1 hypothetical protein [Streptomyces sp. H10-C2]